MSARNIPAHVVFCSLERAVRNLSAPETRASFCPMTDLDLGCIFHSGTAPSPAWSLRGALERREFGHTICGARGPARWCASPPRAAAARRAARSRARDARSRRRRESGRRVIPIRVGRRRVAPPTRAPPGASRTRPHPRSTVTATSTPTQRPSRSPSSRRTARRPSCRCAPSPPRHPRHTSTPRPPRLTFPRPPAPAGAHRPVDARGGAS